MLEKEEGLQIALTENQPEGQVALNVELSMFVNCGSQYAVWYFFPSETLFEVKDLDTGIVYESVAERLSISWDGNGVYDDYAEEPCGKIVTESFSTSLSAIHFKEQSNMPIANFELKAEYLGHRSNLLLIKNTSISLKGR